MPSRGEMAYRIPFTVLTMQPFAVPEKSSTGPLNHCIVELPVGLAGASNGYAAVTMPLEPVYLGDDDAVARWPKRALTTRGVPESLAIPWDVLERAEHAALSMKFSPSSCYVMWSDRVTSGFALLVRELQERDPAEAVIEIPNTPRALPFLADPLVRGAEGGVVEAHMRFNGKFFANLAALGKKAGVDEVFIMQHGGETAPVTITGTQNTGPRYVASVLPSLLTERLFDEDEEQVQWDFDMDVTEAEYTTDDRNGADVRPSHMVGDGVAAIGEGSEGHPIYGDR